MTAGDVGFPTHRSRVAITLFLASAGVAIASLIPDLSTWATPSYCEQCHFDAFSGWPGYVILPLALLLVAAAVLVWTDNSLSSLWKVTLGCGLAIAGVGTFVGMGGEWAFSDATADGAFARGLVYLVEDEPPIPSYGPWLAAVSGVMAVIGSPFARIPEGSRRSLPERPGAGDRPVWSPIVIGGSALALAGGLTGVLHFASVGGTPAAVMYSGYLVLPLVMGLSRSPRVWRPAAALGFLGAAALLVANVVLGYSFVLTVGALVASIGSGFALFAPFHDLPVASGPVGSSADVRVFVGSVAFIGMIAGVVVVGAGSGAT